MVAVAEGVWLFLAAVAAAVAPMVGAWLTYLSHRQTRSPNGIPTGTLTYDTWKRLQEQQQRLAEVWEHSVENRARQIETTRSLAQIEQQQEDHLRLDDERFG